jgi:hypothetical protein
MRKNLLTGYRPFGVHQGGWWFSGSFLACSLVIIKSPTTATHTITRALWLRIIVPWFSWMNMCEMFYDSENGCSSFSCCFARAGPHGVCLSFCCIRRKCTTVFDWEDSRNLKIRIFEAGCTITTNFALMHARYILRHTGTTNNKLTSTFLSFDAWCVSEEALFDRFASYFSAKRSSNVKFGEILIVHLSSCMNKTRTSD